ncbi:MAG: hypothetical protein M1834_009337 [Cirrosporium novae-zelandiae]|nr:MAG: hypothetical protein M1834_009337 [Cirrosporium novae-zelandiae]
MGAAKTFRQLTSIRYLSQEETQLLHVQIHDKYRPTWNNKVSVPDAHHNMRRGMRDLPPELFHIIFELLPVSAIQSFRLVAKALGQIGAQYLFTEIKSQFTSRSFERLLEIARDPIYSNYVKTIWFSIETLPEPGEFVLFRAYQSWVSMYVKALQEMRFLPRQFSVEEDDPIIGSREIMMALEAVGVFPVEGLKRSRTSAAGSRFKNVFKRFPKLQTVVIPLGRKDIGTAAECSYICTSGPSRRAEVIERAFRSYGLWSCDECNYSPDVSRDLYTFLVVHLARSTYSRVLVVTPHREEGLSEKNPLLFESCDYHPIWYWLRS